MKKIFLSLPMNSKTYYEPMKETLTKIVYIAEIVLGDQVEIIDSFLEDAEYNSKPIACLGESIKKMQEADLVVILGNYNIPISRGCDIEEEVARAYGIPILTITDYGFTILPDLKGIKTNNTSIPVKG